MNCESSSTIIQKALEKITVKQKYSFFSAIIFGVIAHGFVFANRIMYHDDAFSINNLGSTLGSERYTLEIIQRILDMTSKNTATAWLNGVISLLFIAIFAVLVVEVLKVQSNLGAILIAGILVSFPAVASVFAYMFTAPAYFMALIFMVVAVLFAQKTTVKGILLGAFCIFIALGDYQAYSSIYAVIVLLLLIKVLLDRNQSWKDFWKLTVSYATSFLLGTLMYMVFNKVLVLITGADNKYATKDLSRFPQAFVKSYAMFVQAFTTDALGTAPYRMIRIVDCILLLVTIVLFIILVSCMGKGMWGRKLFATIIFAIVPAAINFVYILTLDDVEVHSLMVYSLAFIMIIPWVFYEWVVSSRNYEKNINALSWVLTIGLFCNIFLCCKVDNVAYQAAYFTQEQTISYYTTIISRIQQLDGYKADMPVAIMNYSEIEDPNMMINNEFKVTLTVLGMNMESVVSDYTRMQFFKYHCGFCPVWLDGYQPPSLQEQEIIDEMPCYPDDGSVAIVNDVVIVKFK